MLVSGRVISLFLKKLPGLTGQWSWTCHTQTPFHTCHFSGDMAGRCRQNNMILDTLPKPYQSHDAPRPPPFCLHNKLGPRFVPFFWPQNSVDFFVQVRGVRIKHFYGVSNWEIPHFWSHQNGCLLVFWGARTREWLFFISFMILDASYQSWLIFWTYPMFP